MFDTNIDLCHNIPMSKVIKKFKQFVKFVTSFIPSKLPIGVSEFDAWADSVILLTSLPNNESMKWALATMILHGDKAEASKPKRFYARCLHKAAANEIAGGIMHMLKEKQKAEMEAAAKAKTDVVSNESTG